MTAMNSIYRYFLIPFQILIKDSLIETLSLDCGKCNGIAAFNLLIAVGFAPLFLQTKICNLT